MARIFARDNNMISPNNTLAFYLLLTFTIIFFIGCACMGTLAILRRVRKSRQAKDLESGKANHRRSRQSASSISIINEKTLSLEEPYSPTEPVPEIRITFPDDPSADGKRQSRVVVVKIGEKGSIGYEPYQEPLPVYQEKESSRFQDLDLERIGGLREKDIKA